MIKIGIYKHYKGADYKVYGVCKHSETEEVMVLYRCIYGEFDLWIRPLSMFCESVVVNGETVPRFSYLCDAHDILQEDRDNLFKENGS